MFKRTMLATAVAVGFTTTVLATDPSNEARRAQEMREPLEIKQDGQTLMVRAKEHRVTMTIYRPMMLAGLCAFAGTERIALNGIAEIVIVNRFAAQGWVFEGGQAACQEVIRAPLGQPNVALLGRTRLF